MLRLVQFFVVTLFGIALVYGGYLVLRILQERQRMPASIHTILAHADPEIDRLSPHRIAILLRVEDPTFWTNDGIDLTTPGAGYSTLSQSLGKRIFFTRFNPGLEKIELLALTKFALVSVIPKHEILRAVIATEYFGNDAQGEINGFAEGARRWFGRELNQLSDAQFIALVAMLPAPNALDPARHSQENAERVRQIERLLSGKCVPTGLADVVLQGCAT